MSKKSKNIEKLVRKNKITVHLNDKEYNVLKKFIAKYKITNTSKLVRETLFTYILEQFDKDYPTLFPEDKMKNDDNQTKLFD